MACIVGLRESLTRRRSIQTLADYRGALHDAAAGAGNIGQHGYGGQAARAGF